MTGRPRPDRPRWYGRRRGHKLGKGRQYLLDTLLPRLRLLPPEDGFLNLYSVFPKPPEDIWLEVGFGGGEHFAAQARAYPGIGFIGCEPYVNGVAALLARVEGEGISNIRIYDDDARLLFERLPDACFGRVFILFSDPWPKKRHRRRRFIGAETLGDLARLMKDGAEVRFASDDEDYVAWTLEHFIRHSCFAWTARRPRDWRRRPHNGFETRYEIKALARGASCFYLCFIRRSRANPD